MSTIVLNRRRKVVGRRAQVKMFETIGVLIVFILIFAIGLRVYGRVQEQSFMDAKNKFEQFDAIKMSSIVSHLPELVCTARNVQEGACIDLQKALAFEYLMDDVGFQGKYFDIFGQGLIFIDPIDARYPNNITLYNQTPPGSYDVLNTPHPITLYNASDREHIFAVLYVKKYIPVK